MKGQFFSFVHLYWKLSYHGHFKLCITPFHFSSGLLRLLLAATIVALAFPSPIFVKLDPNIVLNPVIPKNFCNLYPELDYAGNVTFIEDCPSLDR